MAAASTDNFISVGSNGVSGCIGIICGGISHAIGGANAVEVGVGGGMKINDTQKLPEYPASVSTGISITVGNIFIKSNQ